MIKIYTLSDPSTGEIRYIGKTVSSLRRRLNQHCCKQSLSQKRYSAHWIRGVVNRGMRPIIELLSEVPEDIWESEERFWIEQFRQWGFKLTNISEGGGSGCLGYRHTDEAKQRISILNSRPKSKGWINNAADAMRSVRSIPIIQYNLDGIKIKEWSSVCYAAKSIKGTYETVKKNITACCRGARSTAYKFKWKYKSVDSKDKEP
jgi:hypothetical protein